MKTHRIAAAIAAIVLPLLAADAQAAELKAPCAATSPCGTNAKSAPARRTSAMCLRADPGSLSSFVGGPPTWESRALQTRVAPSTRLTAFAP